MLHPGKLPSALIVLSMRSLDVHLYIRECMLCDVICVIACVLQTEGGGAPDLGCNAFEQTNLHCLQVKFVGEEGVDEGGVQKEFFQLLVSVLCSLPSLPFLFSHVLVCHTMPALCFYPSSVSAYGII